MALDRSTGPVPRDEFLKLVDAPYGEAVKRIRKYDPTYGLEPGQKIKWRVECEGVMTGYAYVEASSEEEAETLAEKLSASEIDWNDGRGGVEVVSVEPAKVSE